MNYTLEKLEVFVMAESIADEIWRIVSKWELFLKDTIGKQIVRSADSISANIAEGYGRFYYKESKQFFFYARGSVLETKSWISKCLRRKIMKDEICEDLIMRIDAVHLKLNAYIKFISKSALHNAGKTTNKQINQ